MTARRARRRPPIAGADGKESIETAVLKATEAVLQARSLDEIAIADILRESGVSRTSFYFYFESKDAVAAALLRQISGEFRDAMTLWVDDSAIPRIDALRKAILETVSVWRTHRGVLRAAYEAPPLTSEIGEVWRSILDDYSQVAAEHIERERAAGRAPAGPDPRSLATVLMGANNQAFYNHMMSDAPDGDFIDTLAHVWATSVYGVQPTQAAVPKRPRKARPRA
ncbi:TetR/AcrR family transcriptional regulator [Mycolicibacterium sp. CH28]|uniref:TetR/AcrR family transcriptional regulator n=1 Tax=Mycolicibacterium sp. CH28 TaxID=2512237 RepID=UPI001080D59E|nr:TetR/AcrR family transcriptional regulator [Mycolicibacterium sp. CH28]TGD89126.1 TetR/AcrR family transcriptional regulator [Mycolicibacterium sp. CH28]